MLPRLLLALCISIIVHVPRSGAQTFFKVLGGPGRDEVAQTVYRGLGGEIFIGGGVGDSALVQRIDADGNVLWATAFKPPGLYPKTLVNMTMAPDGSLIGCGNGTAPSLQPEEGFHFRMDMDGNLMWARSWTDERIYNRRLEALDASEYLLFSTLYATSTPTNPDILTARIDAATGDLNWVSDRLDLYAPVPYIDDAQAVATIADRHYLATRIFVNGSPVSTCRAAVTLFNDLGEPQWTKYLLYSNTATSRIYPTDLIVKNDSLMMSFVGDADGASTNFTLGLIRLDTLGNVAWAKSYDVPGCAQEYATSVVATPFGYVVSGRTTATNPRRLFLMGVSGNGDVLWAKSYGPATQYQDVVSLYSVNLVDMGDGYLMAGHVEQSDGDRDILLVRTNESGDIVCSGSTPVNIVAQALPTNSYVAPFNYVPYSVGIDDVPAVSTTTPIPDECQLEIALGNDTTLCGTLQLDPGVSNAIYEWSDGSTAATLDVTASGTYWVHVTSDCCVFTDTIEVEIGELAGLDLGPDTALCVGGSVLLEAPAGTWQLEWSDGSTGTELIVDVPGTYWVEANDAGCTAVDSIMVQMTDAPDVDLGPDITVCDGQPVELDPNVTGSDALLWSDGSSADSLLIEAAGLYWMEATNACGTYRDSITVGMAPAMALDLGPDTLLCVEADLLLAPFVDPAWQLDWSDGSQGATLLVTQGGTYYLDAFMDGCTVTDSIAVEDLVAPTFTLGPDTTVCDGSSVEFAPEIVNVDEWTWSDGSAGGTYFVDVSMTLWLEAENTCGALRDSVNVVIIDAPSIDLGPDTALCPGTSLLLEASAAGWSGTWNDGSEGPSLTVEGAGLYWVELVQDDCMVQDSIEVVVLSLPTVELGPDTVLCNGQALVLDPMLANVVDVLWDGGTTSPQLLADVTGLYGVQVFNACGAASDSILVTIVPALGVVLGPDTMLCTGQSLTIDIPGTGASVAWQDGSSADPYTITEEGTYWVTLSMEECLASDTLEVAYSEAPIVDLGPDTTLCQVTSIVLDAGTAGVPGVWQDGSTGRFFNADHTGAYMVSVAHFCGTVRDTVQLVFAPEIPLLGDIGLCAGVRTELRPDPSFISIVWNTGDTLPAIIVGEGLYVYEAVDELGCQYTDSVRVTWDADIDGQAYVPNVFTPNGDDVNDVFQVVGADHEGYELSIFNRWGGLLFESTDPTEGWDGTFRGKTSPDGTYVYVLRHKDHCLDPPSAADRVGHVTLLR